MPLLPAIQMSRQNRLNHAPFRIVASRFSVLEKGLPSCSTSPQDILLYGADSSLHGCRKSPQHTAGRCRGEIVPVKWVKNSVKFTATPDYPNAIYICNTSGQTYSLVTILEVDE